MVVCFILEEKQPVFLSAFGLHLDLNRTGIDFLGFIQLGQLTFFFQNFCCDRTDIHQVNRLSSSDGFSCSKISFISFLDQFIFEFDIIDSRIKCCMSAVIGPICVDHLDFRNSRISVLFIEVSAAELDIRQIHCKTTCCDERIQFLITVVTEPFDGFNFGWKFVIHRQSFRQFQPCFTGFNCIDDIFFYRFQFIIG